MAQVPGNVTSVWYLVTFPVNCKLVRNVDNLRYGLLSFRRTPPILACHFMVNPKQFHFFQIFH
jgi:hypothetical protein